MKKTLTILAAAGALAALAAPAMAETSLYGSARVATFWNSTDVAGTKNTDFDEHVQGNSRFGADFKNDTVGGKVEFGTGVNVRLLYGTWNFGSGTLTAGQDYNSYYLPSAQVHSDDNVNNGYGALWDQRQAQLKVKLSNGLYFAAIQPSKATGPTYFSTNTSTAGEKVYLPKMNVGFAGKAANFTYNAGLVGQTYKNEATDKQINSILGYVQGTAAFGATSLQGSVSYAQNAGNMGFNGRMVYDAANKKDVSGFEGYLQVGQKFSDMLSGYAGFGYTTDKSSASGAKSDDKMLLFVNLPITLAKGVSITPEFSYYDQLKKNGADEKNKQYAYGAKWQINF